MKITRKQNRNRPRATENKLMPEKRELREWKKKVNEKYSLAVVNYISHKDVLCSTGNTSITL